MIVTAYYEKDGLPASGLTVTVAIAEKITGTVVAIGSATESLLGFYDYDFAGYDIAKSYNVLFQADADDDIENKHAVTSIPIPTAPTAEENATAVRDKMDEEEINVNVKKINDKTIIGGSGEGDPLRPETIFYP
jgi:hypothetical protein